MLEAQNLNKQNKQLSEQDNMHLPTEERKREFSENYDKYKSELDYQNTEFHTHGLSKSSTKENSESTEKC